MSARGAVAVAALLLAGGYLFARRAQAAPGTPRQGASSPAPILSASEYADALGLELEAGPLTLPGTRYYAELAPPPTVLDRVSMWIGDAVDTLKQALLPRGIRNKNPGNLRPGSPWVGALGDDGDGYLIFDTPENGIRALAKNLLTYYRRHGLDTVAGIINRWAPPSENNTGSYVRAVAAALGVPPDAKINVPAQLEPLTVAIIRHENGLQPYSTGTIGEGIRRALA